MRRQARVDPALPGRAEPVGPLQLAQPAGERLEPMAAHGQPLVDPGPADEQHHALQAHVAAGGGADRGEVERVLPEGVQDLEAAPAEALGPAVVALGAKQAPAEILGLQHQDAVGQPDQMVDLGPARAVGPRQEDVVHRLDRAGAADGGPSTRRAGRAARTLRAPRRGGQAEPAGEQQRLRAAGT